MLHLPPSTHTSSVAKYLLFFLEHALQVSH
jgi:hypothetical protein